MCSSLNAHEPAGYREKFAAMKLLLQVGPPQGVGRSCLEPCRDGHSVPPSPPRRGRTCLKNWLS